MEQQLYISGFYDSNPEVVGNWIKRGRYDLGSHGTPPDWIIGDKPSDDIQNSEGFLWSVSYNNQRYLYILSFYDDKKITQSLLYQKMNKYSLIKTQASFIYIYLTDQKLSNYDNQGLLDNLGPDELGGQIDEVDLNDFTKDPWISDYEILSNIINGNKKEQYIKESEKYNFSLFDM